MKTTFCILFALFSFATVAQQATELDPKFVKLPRYADLTAITAAISSPQQGMMVYNIGTKSNWFYDGTAWKDMKVSGGTLTLPFSQNQSDVNPLFEITNSGNGPAFRGISTGIGVAVRFESNNPLSTGATVSSITNGKGRAGFFETNNSTNSEDALMGYTLGTGNAIYGLTTGTGSAGKFQIGNASSAADALTVNTLGTGFAGKFMGTKALSANGKSYLNGNVEITDSNWLEFGKGLEKQEDNGKIAYHAFGEANTLSIVGGGVEEDGSDRKIKMWANGGTEFTGSITTSGEIKPNGQSGMPKTVLMNTGNGTMQWQDLIPRLSHEDLLLKAYPSIGDLAYDLTFKTLKHYDGTEWKSLYPNPLNLPDATGYNIGNGKGHSINFDSFGNMYIAGQFTGTLTIGSITLTSAGSTDIFVAKYDSYFEPIWAVKAGGIGGDAAYDLAIDNSQNVYVTGGFSNTATFGAISLTASGGSDIFLIKYDMSGIPVWANQGGSSTNSEYGKKVALDASNNIYITGAFSGVLNLGSTTLTSNGSSSDIYIVKYNSSGILLYAQKAGGNDFDVVMDLCIDTNDNIYICGEVTGNATFAGVSVTSLKHLSFVAKYIPNGSLAWVRTGEATNFTNAYGLAVDQDLNVYVVGYFRDGFSFLGNYYPVNGFSNGFLMKFDQSGNLQWFQQSKGTGSCSYTHVRVDNDGQIYMTGNFTGTIELEEDASLNTLNTIYGDLFIAKYDQSLQSWVYANKFSSTLAAQIYEMAIDLNNNSFVVGDFLGKMTLGSTRLNAIGDNIFLARFD